MSTDRTSQTITLADGRALGFAEWGDPAGTPVFHFHGSGSSRLERPSDESALTDLSIRLVTTDRPGHGVSSPQPNRRLLDWPDDVRQLADQLGIERFYVMGFSAGGPSALACAYKLPDRVQAGAVVAGIAPPERPTPYRGLPVPNRVWMFAARRVPRLVVLIRRMAYPTIMDDSQQASSRLLATFPEVDKELIVTRVGPERFALDIREGYRQGWQGPAQDDIVNNRPWGFALEEITVRIHIWQGDLDKNVPLHQAEYQHHRLPNSTLTVWRGLGHVAFLVRGREVLAKLMQ